MIRTEKKRKTMDAGVREGTKPRLIHSKFSIKTTQDLDDGFYASLAQTGLGQTSSNGNLFKMSEMHKDVSRRTEPEASVPAETRLTTGGPPVRNRGLRTNRSTPDYSTAEDQPKRKHHLEQVFIKPPLNKRD